MNSITNTLYVFWDCESTSNDPKSDDIIAIAMILAIFDAQDKIFVEKASFKSYVYTTRRVHPGAYKVHGISNNTIQGAPTFERLIPMIQNWIRTHTIPTNKIVFVAHNGSRFDDIMLMYNLHKHGFGVMESMRSWKCLGFIDSLVMIKGICKIYSGLTPRDPSTLRKSFTLGNCYYKYCDKRSIVNAHDAMVDSKAMLDIFNSKSVSKYLTSRLLFKYMVPLSKIMSKLPVTITDTPSKEKVVEREIQHSPQNFLLFENDTYLCVNCISFINISFEHSHKCLT